MKMPKELTNFAPLWMTLTLNGQRFQEPHYGLAKLSCSVLFQGAAMRIKTHGKNPPTSAAPPHRRPVRTGFMQLHKSRPKKRVGEAGSSLRAGGKSGISRLQQHAAATGPTTAAKAEAIDPAKKKRPRAASECLVATPSGRPPSAVSQ